MVQGGWLDAQNNGMRMNEMPAGQGFAAGTMVATASGRRNVELLDIGDEVLDATGTPRRVRWTVRIVLTAAHLTAQPEARPIRVRAGALGEGMPRRDLVVAPLTELAVVLPTRALVTLSARLLMNDHTILRDSGTDRLELFEVELDGDAGLIAEDLPAGFALPNHATPDQRTAAVRARKLVNARGGCLPGPLLGRVDCAERGLLYGWAIDEARPLMRVALEILVNGRVFTGAMASLRRNDLVRAGIADGACWFHIEPNPPLPADRTLLVQVRRADDGLDLPGSPVLLDKAGGPAQLLEALKPASPAQTAAMRDVLRAGLDTLQAPPAG
ncbi:MAG: hypothetical protein ABS99_00895 [Acetobacteraceae bacterium SCN 69-10]|nr:MAG: hypothetical protein ABS99_00895 [Acetobacteraceae bacterium SCN 69-10]